MIEHVAKKGINIAAGIATIIKNGFIQLKPKGKEKTRATSHVITPTQASSTPIKSTHTNNMKIRVRIVINKRFHVKDTDSLIASQKDLFFLTKIATT